MATSLLDKLGVKKQTVKPERFASNIVKPYQDLGKRLYEEESFTREVPVEPKTNVFKTQTAETIKQKFGVDVADTSIAGRLRKSATELKMDADQRKEYGQLLQDYIQSEAFDKPIRAGIVEGFQPLDATKNLREKAPEQTRQLEESPQFVGGKVAGTIGQYASMYNLLGPAIGGAGAIPTTGGIGAATGTLTPTLTQKLAFGLGSGVAGAVGTELAKDITIGAGLGAIDATSRGDDVAKTVAENILMDIGFNIAGAGIGKAFKSVKEAIEAAKKAKTPEVVEQVAKSLNLPTTEASKVIDDQIENLATQQPIRSDAFGTNLRQPEKIEGLIGKEKISFDLAKTTDDEILSGLNETIKYNPNLNVEARYSNGKIEVGNKYLELPLESKRTVLTHEIAHSMTEQLSKNEIDAMLDVFDDVYKNRLKYEQILGTNAYEKNYDELATDLITQYIVNPLGLKNSYPDAFELAEALATGKTVKQTKIYKQITPKTIIKNNTEIENKIMMLEDVKEMNPEMFTRKGWQTKLDELKKQAPTQKSLQPTIERPSEFAINRKKLTEKIQEPTTIKSDVLQEIKGKKLLHGTNAQIDQFDITKVGSFTDNEGLYGTGIYVTENPIYAKVFGENVIETSVNVKNPFVIDRNVDLEFISKVTNQPIPSTGLYMDKASEMISVNPREFTKKMQELGYDSVVVKAGPKQTIEEMVVFDTKNIKPTRTMASAIEEPSLTMAGPRVEPTLRPKNIETPRVEPTLKQPDEKLVKEFSDKVVADVTKKPKKKMSERVMEIRKQFEDDLIPLKKLEKSIKGSVSNADESIYKQARLYKGAPERANEIVRTRLAPVIDEAIDNGYTQKELSDYALAVHAKDVNNAGLNSGFTNDQIDAVLRKYANTPLEESRKKLINVSNEMLNDLVESGYISKEQFDAISSKWKNYMPLFRNFDDEMVDVARGISNAFSNVASPIKTLKGSDRAVVDPIESMVKNIYKITDTKMKNNVGVQLSKLADLSPDVIRKLDPKELVGRKNVVTVRVNGEKVKYEVDPEIFKVFNGLDKEASNTLINLLSKPASLLRAGATLTPEFALRNPFRDIQNAYIVSESGFNPFTDFPAGLAATLKKDKLYEQWLKEGGGYGNVMSMDRQAHKEALENALKKPISGKFVNIINPKSWLETLRAISDVTESATKVGEFRAALRSGATPAEAAYRSRDLMDFARAGSSIRPANKVVAFLNANIQGKSKLVRAIKQNPARVTAKIAQTMVLPTVAINVYNNQFASEEQKAVIKDAPDWLRNTFWLVAIPGTDMVARFPKPFDVSAFANITDRFMEYASGREPEAFDGFAKALIKDQSIPTMISGLLPMIEAQANYSFFREGPIIPMGEQYRLKKDQYDTRTSTVARAAAGLVDKAGFSDSNFASPRVMDYVIRSSTAGLGSYVLDSVDAIVGAIDKDKPQKPKLATEQLPLIKAFTVNPLTSGKSLGYVYDTKSRLSQEKTSWRLGLSELDTQRYKKGLLKFDKQKELDLANDIADELSEISKEMKKIESDKTMDAKSKRDKILELNNKRDKVSREGSEKLKKGE